MTNLSSFSHPDYQSKPVFLLWNIKKDIEILQTWEVFVFFGYFCDAFCNFHSMEQNILQNSADLCLVD